MIVAVMAASELGGEVVILHTLDERGGDYTTSLWVVEDGHYLYLRAGKPESTWLLRLKANPDIELERGGRRLSFRAWAAPRYRDQVNERMAAKYGWADWLVSHVRDQSTTTPVQLTRD
jgi:hypothetical protein